MDHYKPHPSATFEGYYAKFQLPSGAHLALIICTVPGAEKKPHMISFTYVPQDTSKLFQRELWVERLDMIPFHNDAIAFEQHFPGGHVKVHSDSTTEYTVENEAFSFHAKTTSHTPWMPDMDTPEGLLVYLPLPLHWHVQSVSSTVNFDLKIKDYDLPSSDTSGTAVVHQEKNWASSFPSAHIWLQARDGPNRGICIAGGQILGLEAYLLGYHSSDPKYSTTFRPPLAVKVAGLSLTMSVKSSWENRSFELSVQSWSRKIVVSAKAPEGTFFGLSSPFADGHRENYLGQSFEATVNVKVYEASWLAPWGLVHEEVFERSSLEFGAGYYGPAGTEKRRN
ncbi:hypothetical protein BDV97DRAFT_386212 [Delphinella strobiligena]|nr:hypothetical protein BDV97DRAFT_386212 [Delphinella strobiligena]